MSQKRTRTNNGSRDEDGNLVQTTPLYHPTTYSNKRFLKLGPNVISLPQAWNGPNPQTNISQVGFNQSTITHYDPSNLPNMIGSYYGFSLDTNGVLDVSQNIAIPVSDFNPATGLIIKRFLGVDNIDVTKTTGNAGGGGLDWPSGENSASYNLQKANITGSSLIRTNAIEQRQSYVIRNATQTGLIGRVKQHYPYNWVPGREHESSDQLNYNPYLSMEVGPTTTTLDRSNDGRPPTDYFGNPELGDGDLTCGNILDGEIMGFKMSGVSWNAAPSANNYIAAVYDTSGAGVVINYYGSYWLFQQNFSLNSSKYLSHPYHSKVENFRDSSNIGYTMCAKYNEEEYAKKREEERALPSPWLPLFGYATLDQQYDDPFAIAGRFTSDPSIVYLNDQYNVSQYPIEMDRRGGPEAWGKTNPGALTYGGGEDTYDIYSLDAQYNNPLLSRGSQKLVFSTGIIGKYGRWDQHYPWDYGTEDMSFQLTFRNIYGLSGNLEVFDTAFETRQNSRHDLFPTRAGSGFDTDHKSYGFVDRLYPFDCSANNFCNRAALSFPNSGLNQGFPANNAETAPGPNAVHFQSNFRRMNATGMVMNKTGRTFVSYGHANPSELGGSSIWYYDPSYADILLPTKKVTDSEAQVFSTATIDETTLYNWRSGITFNDQIVGRYYPSWFSIEDTYNPASGATTITQTTSSHLVGSIPIDESPNAIISATNGNINSIVLVEEGNVEFLYALDISNNQIIKKNVTDLTGSASTWATLDALSNASNGNSYYGLAYNQAFDPTSSETSKKYMFYLSVTGVIANGGLDTRNAETQATGMVLPAQESDGDGYIMGLAANSSYEYVSSSSGNILGDGTNNNLFRPGYMCTDGSGSLVVMVDNNRASGGYIDQPSTYSIYGDNPLLADYGISSTSFIKVRHEQGGKPRVPGNMYRLTAPSGTNNFNKYPDSSGNSQQLTHYSSSIFQPATFDFSTNDLGNYQFQLDVSRTSDPSDAARILFEGSYNAWIEDLRNVQFQSYRKNGGYMVPAQPVWISTSESTFLLPHSIDEYLSPTTEPSLNTYLNLTAVDAIRNHGLKKDEYLKIYSKMRQIQTYELSHDSNKYTTAAAATAAGYQLVTIPQNITNPANDVTSIVDLSQVALYNQVSTGDYGTYDNRKVIQSDNTINPAYATFVNKIDTLQDAISEALTADAVSSALLTAANNDENDPSYQAAVTITLAKQQIAENAAADLIMNHQFDPSRNPPCGFFNDSIGLNSGYMREAPIPASFEFLGQLYEFNDFTGANNLEGLKWSEQMSGGDRYTVWRTLWLANTDVIRNRETAYRRAAARARYESLTDASFIAGSLAENTKTYTDMIDDIYSKFDTYEAAQRLLDSYQAIGADYTDASINEQRVVVNDASAALIPLIDKAILLTGTSNVQEYAGSGLSSEFIFYYSMEEYGPNDWSANNGNEASYEDPVTGQTITFDIAESDFYNGELNLRVKNRHKALEPPPINYNDPAANPNTRNQYAEFNVLYAAYLEMDVNALLDPVYNIPTYEGTGSLDSQNRPAYRIVEDPSGFTIADFNNTQIGDLISNSDSTLALYSSTTFNDHNNGNWSGSANPFRSSNWGSSLEAAYNSLIAAIRANTEADKGIGLGFVVVDNNPAIFLTAETHPLIMPLNYLYQYINNTFNREAEAADANLKRKNEKCWSLFNYSINRAKDDLTGSPEGALLYGMGPYMLGGPDMGQGDLGINNDYSALQTTTAAAADGFSFDWVSTLGYNSNAGLPVNDVQQIEIRYGNNMNPQISFFTYWDGQGYPMTGPQNQYIMYNNIDLSPGGMGSSGYYWSFDVNGNRGNEVVLDSNGNPVLDPNNYYYPEVTKTSRSGSGGNQVLYYKHIDASGTRVSGRNEDGSLVGSPRIAVVSDVSGTIIRDLIGHEDGSYFPQVLANKSYFTYVNTGPVNNADDANRLGLNANPNFNPSWGTQDASNAGTNYPNGMIAMQEDAVNNFEGGPGGGFGEDDPDYGDGGFDDPFARATPFRTNNMTLLERNQAILAYNQHVGSSNPIRTNKFVGGVEPLAPNLSVDGTSLPMGIPRRAIGSTDARYFSYYSVDKTRTDPGSDIDREHMALQVTNAEYRNDFTTYGYNYQNARPQNYWPWNTLLIRNRHQRASLGCAMDFCTPFVFDVSYSSQDPTAIHSINYPPPVLNNTTTNATDLAAQPASGAWVINNPDISANFSDGTDNDPMPFTPYVFNYQNQGYISTVFDYSYIDSTSYASPVVVTQTKEVGGVNRFVNVKGVSDPSFISAGTISVACLAEGTNIDCYMERIKVEDLQVGDMVRTYKHGHKKVVHIEKTDMNDQVMNFRLDSLFCAKKEDLPALSEDLYVTGGHSILLDSLTEIEKWHMKNISWPGHFFQVDGKYKLLAAHYEKFQITNKKVKVYNIILEQDDENDMYVSYGIYANGLLVETCNKGSLLHIFEKKKTESEIKADLDVETKNVLEVTEKVK